MATGRIGVTPVLRTRWSDQPTAGTTSLSGLDDNSVALVYDAGYEAVYRNGVLLSRGNDYTATNGTSITLIDATLAGDIIEVFANDLVPLTDAISKGQYTAKGALLSASAASTPAVLAVGSNNQVLTADSAETTGLKWATPSSGALVFISGASFSAQSSVSLPTDTFTSTYTNYVIKLTLTACSSANDFAVRGRISGTDTTTGYSYAQQQGNVSSAASQTGSTNADRMYLLGATTANECAGSIEVFSPKTTDAMRLYYGGISSGLSVLHSMGISPNTNAYDSLTFLPSTGTCTGFYKVYGYANS